MLGKFNLRDQRCSESHTLLTFASDAAPVLSIFCPTCKPIDTTDTVPYHMAGIGSFMKIGAVQSIPYLLVGVNESVYTLLTFTVRFGRSSVHEIRAKWLKFGIQHLYKMAARR